MNKQRSKQNKSVRQTTVVTKTVKQPVRIVPTVSNQRGGASSSRSAPVAISRRRSGNGVPQTQNINDGKGSVIVSHREYIGEVFSHATANILKIQTFPLNPGLITTFPWLCKMGQSFEMYQFLELGFDIDSVVGTNRDGSWYLAVDYDAVDLPPTTLIEIMNNKTTEKASIWDSVKMRCSPQAMHVYRDRYTRSGPAPTDAKTYDTGTFIIATQTDLVNKKLGDLYVNYKVRLSVPQYSMSVSVPSSKTNSMYFSEPYTGGPSKMFGSVPVAQAGSIDPSLPNSGNVFPRDENSISFPTAQDSFISIASRISALEDIYNGFRLKWPDTVDFIVNVLDKSDWSVPVVTSSDAREWLNLAVSTKKGGYMIMELLQNSTTVASSQVLDTVVHAIPAQLTNLVSAFAMKNDKYDIVESRDPVAGTRSLTVLKKSDPPALSRVPTSGLGFRSQNRGFESLRQNTPLTPHSPTHLGSS